MPDDSISFRLRHSLSDPNQRGWLFVPMSVGEDYVLEMLPTPFSPRSSIGQRALADLTARALIALSGPPFWLRDLRIVGPPVPDAVVRLSAASNLLRVDGILGFDFFGRFRHIGVDTQTRWMTLSQDE